MAEKFVPTGLDVVLKELGVFGKYNVINYILLLFPCFLAGMYQPVFVFEATDVDYRCHVSVCESTANESQWLYFAIPKEKDGFSKCEKYALKDSSNPSCTASAFDTSKTEKCDSYVYSSNESSAVIDFNLGCENWKRTLVGTFHNAGLFISLPMTGVISDRFGRKIALPIAGLMNCIFGFSRSFSTSYAMMVVFEFMETSLGAGAYTTAFVLAMELVVPKGRVFGNTLINICFVSGSMSLAGLAWLLQDWRTLLRVIYAPSCLVFTYLFIMNESVRWLLSKGRRDEAIKILKKAAKMNRVEISDQALTSLREYEKSPIEDNRKARSPVFMQLVKSSLIRRRVICCSFLWITCTFVYYGLSINSVSLGGNKYINFMLVTFIEIPANIACLLVLDRLGRKKVMTTGFMLSAILCISLSFLPKESYWLPLLFYLSGKFAITVAYCSVYIYVSEVFPTNARQSLLAMCSSIGRVGSVLAPLTPILALYYQNLPAIFFGTLAIVAGILVLTLPETINVHLPDTVEEAERLDMLKKNFDEELTNCA